MTATIPARSVQPTLPSGWHVLALALEGAAAQITHLFGAAASPARTQDQTVKVKLETMVTVPCRNEALYALCRCPDNLVWFLEPVREVREVRPNRFHWQLASGEAAQSLEMRLGVAEYGQRIVWESTSQNDLGLRVEMTMAEAENCFETDLRVRLEFRAGDDAQVRRLATLLGEDPEGDVRRGLEGLIEMLA